MPGTNCGAAGLAAMLGVGVHAPKGRGVGVVDLSRAGAWTEVGDTIRPLLMQPANSGEIRGT